MAKADETNGQEPVTPGIPPVGQRQHVATFARDKRNPGKYLIRVEGPHAARFEGREVPVSRKDRTESIETLAEPVWSGIDDESGAPVALYRFIEKERTDTDDALPF